MIPVFTLLLLTGLTLAAFASRKTRTPAVHGRSEIRVRRAQVGEDDTDLARAQSSGPDRLLGPEDEERRRAHEAHDRLVERVRSGRAAEEAPHDQFETYPTKWLIEGVGADLEVFDDKLVITPRGVVGVMARGLKGSKSIPFISITAIQHKRAGVTSGYLQFTLAGGIESRGGVLAAGRDENTFMFGKDANEAVAGIKEHIERRQRELRNASPVVSAPAQSLADEFAKLARLREQGILTAEEFSAAKQKLLASR